MLKVFTCFINKSDFELHFPTSETRKNFQWKMCKMNVQNRSDWFIRLPLLAMNVITFNLMQNAQNRHSTKRRKVQRISRVKMDLWNLKHSKISFLVELGHFFHLRFSLFSPFLKLGKKSFERISWSEFSVSFPEIWSSPKPIIIIIWKISLFRGSQRRNLDFFYFENKRQNFLTSCQR